MQLFELTWILSMRSKAYRTVYSDATAQNTRHHQRAQHPQHNWETQHKTTNTTQKQGGAIQGWVAVSWDGTRNQSKRRFKSLCYYKYQKGDVAQLSCKDCCIHPHTHFCVSASVTRQSWSQTFLQEILRKRSPHKVLIRNTSVSSFCSTLMEFQHKCSSPHGHTFIWLFLNLKREHLSFYHKHPWSVRKKMIQVPFWASSLSSTSLHQKTTTDRLQGSGQPLFFSLNPAVRKTPEEDFPHQVKVIRWRFELCSLWVFLCSQETWSILYSAHAWCPLWVCARISPGQSSPAGGVRPHGSGLGALGVCRGPYGCSWCPARSEEPRPPGARPSPTSPAP